MEIFMKKMAVYIHKNMSLQCLNVQKGKRRRNNSERGKGTIRNNVSLKGTSDGQFNTRTR